MNKISAVIIAKDEEKIIKRCLDSLRWCDEIIVVINTDSSDQTCEIAKKYTSKVFIQDWLGYGPQKNFAISKSTYDWILSIDADEVVSGELSKEMQAVLDNPIYDGYYINFDTFVGQKQIKHGGLQNDWHLRLFKKSRGQFGGQFGGDVHESVSIDNSGKLIHHIQHFSYKDWSDYRAKVLKYSKIEAENYFKNNKKLNLKDWIKPILRLINIFLFKRGFMDGITGIKHAYLLSYYIWKRNQYILDMINTK